MYDCKQFYIDGRWVPPARPETLDVLDPATEEAVGVISLGSRDDVDAAVRAARRAFPAFSLTSREERLDILDCVIAGYKARADDLARAVTAEMGAPARLSSRAQVPSALGHLVEARRTLEDFGFEDFLETKAVMGYEAA